MQGPSHPRMHRPEEEDELAESETESVEQQPAERHLWTRHEDDHRNRDDQKSQRCEEEWREMIQADANGQEVQTPQDDHGQAEETVAGSHALIVSRTKHQNKRI